MGIFPTASHFDADVEKATNENNTSEDWGQIMEICDKVDHSSQHAKDCLKSIVKRLNCQDPHIVIQAITLLDACSSNCGKPFHLEIASREFETELRKLIIHPQSKISEKMRALLKKWAEGDFKTDRELNLIPSLYNKLKSEGVDFFSASETQPKRTVLSKDPNIVSSSQEEEDIAKAIELSLKETKSQSQAASSQSSPASKKNSSLYPSVSSVLVNSTTAVAEAKKARALYDFEAAEDNELTFLAGEIIQILDDSNPNWWKGSNHRGEGLFPSSFVTLDLSVEPEQFTKLEIGNKKLVQFADEVEVKTVRREPEVVEVEIDERKIDRLLHLLHEADPQCDSSDPQEMLHLEEQVTGMSPLIDAALEKVDRRHAQLTQLSSDLVDACNLYHTLMREPPPALPNYNIRKMMPSYQNPANPHQPHLYGMLPPHQQPPYGLPSLPSGHYGTSMPNEEYASLPHMQNMGITPHFHMQPGPHQQPGHPSGPPVPDQASSLSYQPQGYPPQAAPLPGHYGPPGAAGLPVNQQTQYAPQNGQNMM
ncbi:signal transducing adapter molecule 1 isoform X2 [Prorops nasuta]|uniref:signal transducing adapter molecule 1 isoform X2 n=1 Tax=Prorops nasuta TaxID=863751 RepID=UPI0034CFF09D